MSIITNIYVSIHKYKKRSIMFNYTYSNMNSNIFDFVLVWIM